MSDDTTFGHLKIADSGKSVSLVAAERFWDKDFSIPDGVYRVVAVEQRQPAAWLDPDANRVITAAEREAADARAALWHRGYVVPLYR